MAAVSTSRVIAGLTICFLIAMFLVVLLSVQRVGCGGFDQLVIIESFRPIAKVQFANWRVDNATRFQAESTADSRLFDWEPVIRRFDTQFECSIFTTFRDGLFRAEVYHMPHLVLYIEFADGGVACRVVDIPAGQGTEPIVICL